MEQTFRAHCARGHDRIDFDGDREGFERHMISLHGARKTAPGRPAWHGHGSAPGWTVGGNIAKPYPWKAPKRDADGGAKRLAQWAEAGELVIEEVGDDEAARAS